VFFKQPSRNPLSPVPWTRPQLPLMLVVYGVYVPECCHSSGSAESLSKANAAQFGQLFLCGLSAALAKLVCA